SSDLSASISGASVSCLQTKPTTSCSSSNRSALCSPTTPFHLKTPASRRLAICARARSGSISTAPVLVASSSSSRGSAWARLAPSTPSPTTENPPLAARTGPARLAVRAERKGRNDPRSLWPRPKPLRSTGAHSAVPAAGDFQYPARPLPAGRPVCGRGRCRHRQEHRETGAVRTRPETHDHPHWRDEEVL